MPTDARNLSLRVPLTWLSRADALIATMEAERPPELATAGAIARADVIRVALVRGLASLERTYRRRTDDDPTP